MQAYLGLTTILNLDCFLFHYFNMYSGIQNTELQTKFV